MGELSHEPGLLTPTQFFPQAHFLEQFHHGPASNQSQGYPKKGLKKLHTKDNNTLLLETSTSSEIAGNQAEPAQAVVMYDRDPSTTRSCTKEILWSLLLLLITFGKTCLWRQHCFKQIHAYLSLQFLTPLPVPRCLTQTFRTKLPWHVRHLHLPNQTSVYAQVLFFFL